MRVKYMRKRYGALCGVVLSMLLVTACARPFQDYQATTQPSTQTAPQQTSQQPVVTPPVTWQPLSETSSAPIDKPRQIALLVPLSGNDRNLGQSLLNAAQLALFDMQAEGVAIRPYDTRGTEQGAGNAARQALQEGADFILGPVFASNVRTVKPILAEANKSFISFSNDRSVAGNNAYILGILPQDQVRHIIRYAADNGINRFAALLPESAYGAMVEEALHTAVQQTGGRLIAVEKVSTDMNSIQAAAQRLGRIAPKVNDAGEPQQRADTFQALLIPFTGTQLQAVTSMLAFYDITPGAKLLGTAVWQQDPTVFKEDVLNGAWLAAPSPRNRGHFQESYRSVYGSNPSSIASLAYDGAALAVVLSRRGATTFNLQDIQDVSGFAGSDGIFRFQRNGTAERGLAILEVGRNDFREIQPSPSSFQQAGY